MSYATARSRGANADLNKLLPEDRAVHEWYRFVLSYPPHLVRSGDASTWVRDRAASVGALA